MQDPVTPTPFRQTASSDLSTAIARYAAARSDAPRGAGPGTRRPTACKPSSPRTCTNHCAFFACN